MRAYGLSDAPAPPLALVMRTCSGVCTRASGRGLASPHSIAVTATRPTTKHRSSANGTGFLPCLPASLPPSPSRSLPPSIPFTPSRTPPSLVLRLSPSHRPFHSVPPSLPPSLLSFLTPSPTYSLTHSLNHSRTHARTHTLTQSFYFCPSRLPSLRDPPCLPHSLLHSFSPSLTFFCLNL